MSKFRTPMHGASSSARLHLKEAAAGKTRSEINLNKKRRKKKKNRLLLLVGLRPFIPKTVCISVDYPVLHLAINTATVRLSPRLLICKTHAFQMNQSQFLLTYSMCEIFRNAYTVRVSI